MNGAAFLIGWLLALGIIGVIVLAVAGPVSSSGEFAMWVSWLEIVLGTLLLVVAIRQFRGRPSGGNQVLMPRWMGAIDKLTPGAALAAGALLAAANPKNLLLSVVGAATIARAGIGGSRQAIAYLAFVVIATIGVGVPVAIYVLMGAAIAAAARQTEGLDHPVQRPDHVHCLPCSQRYIHRGRSHRTHRIAGAISGRGPGSRARGHR
jgi:hypothetical protein